MSELEEYVAAESAKARMVENCKAAAWLADPEAGEPRSASECLRHAKRIGAAIGVDPLPLIAEQRTKIEEAKTRAIDLCLAMPAFDGRDLIEERLCVGELLMGGCSEPHEWEPFHAALAAARAAVVA